MKKVMYALFFLLLAVSGWVFANRESKKEKARDEMAKAPTPRPITAAEREAAMKQWYTTPGGQQYKKWSAAPEGKKVLAEAAKIRQHINDSSYMEAIVTSLTLPPGSRLGFGVMARIDGVDYILTFDADKSQLEALQSLQVNDKLMIKSTVVSHAPKYAYAIVRVESAEQHRSIIYKRIPPKDGC